MCLSMSLHLGDEVFDMYSMCFMSLHLGDEVFDMYSMCFQYVSPPGE